MPSTRELELAALAYMSYAPFDENKLSTGDWSPDSRLSIIDAESGLAATTYVNSSGEVVIAFRGTDDPIGLSEADWAQGNVPGALGWHAPQVAAAMRLVADVVARYPTAKITLTGHSLGGGLASIVAACFDLPAVVFDPAPLGAALAGRYFDLDTGWMDSTVVVHRYYDDLRQYVLATYPIGTVTTATAVALNNLQRSFFDLIDGVEPYEQRKLNTTGYFLLGEGLQPYRNNFDMASAPLVPVDPGATQLTDGVALHGMPLLLGMLAAPSLQNASARLPTLLPQLVDESLYAYDDHSQQTNFLNRLLAAQLDPAGTAASSALERFAQELLRLGTSGSTRLPGVERALIATTMEYYYYADLSNATPFLETVAGGLRFDLQRIPSTSNHHGQDVLLDAARDLVATGLGGFTRQQAEAATLWTVNSGDVGLATDGAVASEVQIGSATHANTLHGAAGNDVLMSGSAADVLRGDDGADLLLGGAGDDLLVGGTGNDYLVGGAGFDVYTFERGDGADALLDSDHDGSVVIDDSAVAGGLGARRLRSILNPSWSWYSGGKRFEAILVGGTPAVDGNLVRYSDATLLLRHADTNDWVTIRHFSSGDLGLDLYGLPGTRAATALADAKRIAAQLRRQMDVAKQTASPLILDLDGDGVETTSLALGTHFDHDANGFAEATGWVGTDDGLLVLDRNANGVIDNGHELFGNNTPLPDGSYAADGFAALAALDANGDGRINASDPAYAQLRIWRDANGNALTDTGELRTLSAAGVASIATACQPLHAIESNGNEHLQTGTYTTAGGLTRNVDDVWFAANTTTATPPAEVPVSADIEALPDIAGLGSVPSLHQAMQLDASGHLRDLVTRYAAENDPVARAALLQSIVFAWAGVESLDPASRGRYVNDARTLAAVEKFTGEAFVQGFGITGGTSNPGPNAAPRLATAYTDVAAWVDGQLMAQTHLKSLYEGVAVGLAADGESITWEIGAPLAQLRAVYAADPVAGEALLKSFATSLRQDEAIGAPVLAALRAASATEGGDFGRALSTAAVDGVVQGTAGVDVLIGTAASELLLGAEGDDNLDGGGGNDVLDGGAGNDLLAGHLGSDTYLFGRGSGADTIANTDTDAARDDVVELTGGLRETDIELRREGNDLVITIRGASDRLSVRGYFEGGTVAANAIDAIDFANGSRWDRAEITERVLQTQATEGSDTLRALATAVRLRGLGGDDTLVGSAADDLLRGDGGNDTIRAGAGDDVIEGGTGNDVLAGEAGNNTYRFARGDGADLIESWHDLTAGKRNTLAFGAGIAPADLVLGRNGFDDLVIGIAGTGDAITIRQAHYAPDAPIQQLCFADGTTLDLARALAAGETTLSLTEAGALVAIGNDAANTITGSALSNLLDGGAGADTLAGGAGDDTYIVDTARSHFYWEDSNELWSFLDTVSEQPGAGTDTILARNVYSAVLPDNVERLIVQGQLTFATSFNLTQDVRRRFTGNVLDNLIDASAATGGSVGQGYTNSSGADLGETVIDGGAGADLMIGPTTITRFVVDDPGDVVVSHSIVTRIDASISYTLADSFSDLTLTGAAAISGTGNARDNRLDGSLNAAANVLAGGAGNDTYVVGTGDTVVEAAGAGTDTVRSAASHTLADNVENLTLTGNGSTTGRGNALDNVIIGTDASIAGLNGANYLVGGGGNDRLQGGTGNDAYADFDVTSGLDVILDTGGTDQIQSVLDSGYDIDQLLFARSGNDLTIGVDAANGLRIQSWYANPANVIEALSINVAGLWYRYSAAQMQGRADGINTAPVVQAQLANRTATTGQVFACAFDANTFVDIESQHALVYTATLADGTALPAWLAFDAATRSFTGTPPAGSTGTLAIRVVATDAGGLGASSTFSLAIAAGSGSLTGTSGNDVLTGGAGDDVIDGLGGNDRLDGAGGNDTLRGGAGTDTLLGGTGNDVLDGGSGSDSMSGGTGDDTYYVDASADTTTESAAAGLDSVYSAVTRTLSANIELLFLTGSSALNGSGNGLANLLRGNGAANTLSGGGGVDILEGGAGNDTLSNSSGNTLLSGGSGADRLTGASGNDLLIGGLGNDALTTGSGADVILFNKGDGADTVAVSTKKDNTLSLGGGARYADLLFQKSGNDLVLKLGGGDQITFTGYYASTSNRSVKTLQVVIEGNADYAPGSASALYNRKVESFNFDGLVAAFDAARAANPALSSWALGNALAAQYLSGSDGAAIGGELAYQYGRWGTLSALSFTPAQGVLGAAGFGSTAQGMLAAGSLQDTSPRLN